MHAQFNIFLALPPSVPPGIYDILTDTRSRSRQYIDRRERLGRVNSGENLHVKIRSAAFGSNYIVKKCPGQHFDDELLFMPKGKTIGKTKKSSFCLSLFCVATLHNFINFPFCSRVCRLTENCGELG